MEGELELLCHEGFRPPGVYDITKYMYAGTLNNVTGVDILLDAIKMFDNEKSEIYTTGKGELEAAVSKAAENDTRIKYIGFIPNYEHYQLMEKMDVFINPRNMDLEQNKNIFPLKVFEYLATVCVKRRIGENCLGRNGNGVKRYLNEELLASEMIVGGEMLVWKN